MVTARDFERVEEYKSWLRHARLFRDYPMVEIRKSGLRYVPRITSVVEGALFKELMDQWEHVLGRGTDSELEEFALEVSPEGIDRRQNSPLIGVMSHEDRLQVLKDARREFDAVH
jgi:hypothetical protein